MKIEFIQSSLFVTEELGNSPSGNIGLICEDEPVCVSVVCACTVCVCVCVCVSEGSLSALLFTVGGTTDVLFG